MSEYNIYKLNETLKAVCVPPALPGKRSLEKEPYYVLLVDESGSMYDRYEGKSRFGWGMDAVKALTKGEQNFAVLFYSTCINKIYTEPSRHLNNHACKGGGTDIWKALAVTLDLLNPQCTDKPEHPDISIDAFNINTMDEPEEDARALLNSVSEKFDVHLVLLTDGQDSEFIDKLQSGAYKKSGLFQAMNLLTSFTGVGIGECNSSTMQLWEKLHDRSAMYKVTPNGIEDIVVAIKKRANKRKWTVQLEIPQLGPLDAMKVDAFQSVEEAEVVLVDKCCPVQECLPVPADLRRAVMLAALDYYIDLAFQPEQEHGGFIKTLDDCAEILGSLRDDKTQTEYERGIKRLALLIHGSTSSSCDIQSSRVASQSLSITDKAEMPDEFDLARVESVMVDFADLRVRSGRTLSSMLTDGSSSYVFVEESQRY